MHILVKKVFWLLLGLMLLGGVAQADEAEQTYDRIDFSTNVSEQVQNDTLVALLYARHEHKDAAQAASQVNEAITWAVKKAKAVPGIKVQTLGYRTNPVYRKQLMTAWQARQSMRLESQDSARLSQLVGELQGRLAVERIQYEVSPVLRQQVEDSLIAKALAQFKERAKLIATELGHTSYRMVKMEVNTSGGGRPIAPRRSFVMEADGGAVPPPTLEGGTQKLQVMVSGTIELQ